MIEKTELEITKNWKDIDDVVISICCATYNHEDYISQALDGFLLQESDYVFEILIHDDCSTDDTANIIREYEKRYPKLIKPIYQTENQYSQGIKPDLRFNFSRAKGKYIARCEGDDYWTDHKKLQKQINFLEKNREYTMCFHRAAITNENSKEITAYHPNIEIDSDFIIADLINGNQAPTASVIYRYDRNISLPENFNKFKLGDWPLNMIYASRGKVKYFSDIMSIYRIHAGGVWSNAKESTNNEYTLYMLKEMDYYFNYRFHHFFTTVILKQTYQQIKFFIKEDKINQAFSLYHSLKNTKYKMPAIFKFRLLTKLYTSFISSKLKRF